MFRDKYLKQTLLAGAARPLLTIDDGAGDGGASGGGGEAPAGGEAQAGEAPAGGDGDTGAEGEEAPAEEAAAAEDEAPPPRARIPWYNKRIDGLTAEKRAEQERREAAEAEARTAKEQLAAYQALYGTDAGAPPASGAPAPTPAADGARVYTEDDFNAEAARRAENTRLNERLEDLFQDGVVKYGDTWKDQVKAAGQAFGADLGQRVDLFKALAKLPNATDVYHKLTGDLDHMAEVLTMTPVELGMELAQLSVQASVKPKTPPVSRVPAPITPVNGNGGEGAGAAESMDEYAARREREREERFAARH